MVEKAKEPAGEQQFFAFYRALWADRLGIIQKIGSSRRSQRLNDVPTAQRRSERLLRVAQAADVEPGRGGRPAALTDPHLVRSEPRCLRSPARLPGTARSRRDLQQA